MVLGQSVEPALFPSMMLLMSAFSDTGGLCLPLTVNLSQSASKVVTLSVNSFVG